MNNTRNNDSIGAAQLLYSVLRNANAERDQKLMTKLHLLCFSLPLSHVPSCSNARFIAKSTTKSVLSEHEQRRIFSKNQQQQQ